MPVDATEKILNEAVSANENVPVLFPMEQLTWNINDVDRRSYMIDRRMSGCFWLGSRKPIDPEHPGNILVDGQPVGIPLFHEGFMGSQIIALFLRPFLRQYDRSYTITYQNAVTLDGQVLEPYTFQLRTLPHMRPGEVYPEHDSIVLQAAREGIVLLKNDHHVLPLPKNSVVNAFGSGVAIFRLGCVGAGKINSRYGIRFEEGIKEYSSLKLNQPLFDFYTSEQDILPDDQMMQQAREMSDTAVVVLTRGTGESIDNRPEKGGYYLTDRERELIKGVRDTFKRVAVVLNTGYPIEMKWVDEYQIDAVIWTGLPGMAGGRALAEILEGSVNPSGRLPDTWSYDYYDIPSAQNFYLPPAEKAGNRGEHEYSVIGYEEGLYVGYRYFSTFNRPVAYPFGHGLSYTTFARKLTRFSATGAAVQIDVTVTNTGDRPGKEVVLVFAEIPDGRLEQPTRRLVAFAKTDELAPGASQILPVSIRPERFNSYDEATARWMIEPGCIRLYLGGSVQQAVEVADFTVEKEIVTAQVENRLQPPVALTELSKNNPDSYPSGKLTGLYQGDSLPYARPRQYTPEPHPVTGTKPDHLITYPMVKKDPSLLESFVLQMSDEQLCRFLVGARTGWGPEDNGFAGTIYTTGVLQAFELPEYYFSDGNNGLNMFDANIGFPTSNLVAATFNEQISFEEGKAIGEEAKGMKLQNILAPSMNIHRNPLCGRHSEYFSEDPLLSGRMAGQESRGLESVGVASCMKHFFANNAETLRNTCHAIMTERTAREIYLKTFEYALEVHVPDSFMTGYNPANGCWCSDDPELLQGILRDEWGYEGYIMTDWGASFSCSPVTIEAASGGWIAPGEMDDTEVRPMVQAIENGTLDRERVRKNVWRMMRSLIRYPEMK